MLYGNLYFLLEADRVFDIEHVAGLVAALIPWSYGGHNRRPPLKDRAAVALERVVLHPPCLVEVVLRSGAVQIWRPLVAIDPDHVVSLTPPVAAEVRHAKVAPYVMAAPLCFHNDVVVVPSQAFLVGYVRQMRACAVGRDLVTPSTKWIRAAELGVKQTCVGGHVGHGLVVDVKVLVVDLVALVYQLHQGTLIKWHRQVAVERTSLVELVREACRSGKKLGLVRSNYTIAEAEEIAYRTQNAWKRRIVPGYLK